MDELKRFEIALKQVREMIDTSVHVQPRVYKHQDAILSLVELHLAFVKGNDDEEEAEDEDDGRI